MFRVFNKSDKLYLEIHSCIITLDLIEGPFVQDLVASTVALRLQIVTSWACAVGESTVVSI